MKPFKLILSLIIISVSVMLCQQIISISLSNQKNKMDYAELNHVRYGLLSIDMWEQQISAILASEINKVDLSRTNERALRKHVEVLLDKLIDDVYEKIREENEGSAKGWVKQTFINMFISLEDIKKGIPTYTDSVMHEIKRSKTKAQIQTLLKKQLEHYSAQTYDPQDRSHLTRILLETGSADIGAARIKLDQAILIKQNLIFKESLLLILLSVFMFALSGFTKHPLAPLRYMLLVLTLIILLIPGVMTPMIDLDAKISQMGFVLMGHPIHFENQVLYFQSKSILDVFWIMITHKDIQMKLVGILMITFSIVFPLVKIALSLGYYYNYHQARENPVIQFFVLKSGKWSMADVMVVAIFMAYIGFNGIITSQLGQLSTARQELVILSTNGTSLQPGYYLFLTYTLLALFFSGFLTRKPGVKPREAG